MLATGHSLRLSLISSLSLLSHLMSPSEEDFQVPLFHERHSSEKHQLRMLEFLVNWPTSRKSARIIIRFCAAF